MNNECGENFVHGRDFKKHLKSKDILWGMEKPGTLAVYYCDKCAKTWKYEEILWKHIRIVHENIKL